MPAGTGEAAAFWISLIDGGKKLVYNKVIFYAEERAMWIADGWRDYELLD